MSRSAPHASLNRWLHCCLGLALSLALGAAGAHALDLREIEITTVQSSFAGVDLGWEFEACAGGTDLESGTVRPPGAAVAENLLFAGQDGAIAYRCLEAGFPSASALRSRYPNGSYAFTLNDSLMGNLFYNLPLPTGSVLITSPSDGQTLPGTPQTFTISNSCTNCDLLVFLILEAAADGFEAVFVTQDLSTSSVDFDDFGISLIPDGEYFFAAAAAIGALSDEQFGSDSFEYFASVQTGDLITFFVPEPGLFWLQLTALASLVCVRCRLACLRHHPEHPDGAP